jgi:hypothetical protein
MLPPKSPGMGENVKRILFAAWLICLLFAATNALAQSGTISGTVATLRAR